MADNTLFSAFNFTVELNIKNHQRFELSKPLCEGAFAECDGLEMSMEPKTVQEGGNNTQQIHLVGPVTYGTLSLKRGMTTNFDMWKWFTAVTTGQGRGTTADGLVTMNDGAGNAQVRFKLTGCLPIKIKAPGLNAKEGLLAIEEIEIAYRHFEIQPV